MLGFGHTTHQLRQILAQETCAVIFNHIFKTAGTTVERAIAAAPNFVPVRCHTPQERADLLEEAAAGAFKGKRIFIYGHEVGGVSEALVELGYAIGKNQLRFTFLRDPMARLESHYNYSKVRRHDYNVPISKFASQYPENFYCTTLNTGNPVHWLEKGVEFVGTQEDFDLSISILYAILGIDPEREVNSYLINKHKETFLNPKDFSLFYGRNSRDYRLYQQARATLQYIGTEMGVEMVSVVAGEGSELRKRERNMNVRSNNDHVSLMGIGRDLLLQDPEQAMPFLTKAVNLSLINLRAARILIMRSAPERWPAFESGLREHFTPAARLEMDRILMAD